MLKLTKEDLENELKIAKQDGINYAAEILPEKYKQWCKQTGRSGSVLVNGSINVFFTWLKEDLYLKIKS